MRFQVNCQKVASLLLASCAFSASLHSMSTMTLAQQPGAIVIAGNIHGGASSHIGDARQLGLVKLTRDPTFGGATTASGTQTETNGEELAVGNEDSGTSETPIQTSDLGSKVNAVDISVADVGKGVLPEAAFDKRQTEGTYERLTVQKCVYWQPSSICHYPLRFEETMLERHGHVRLGCLQPLVSGVRFFTTIPMLPYLNTLQPCYEPVYALGNYRPGSCAPLLRDTIPYDKHAAVVEAMAVAGFFWAMPL